MNSENTPQTNKKQKNAAAYWRANVKLLLGLLVVWFLVSFGAGILFADALNTYTFMGFPLGFWFAQQGSIYVFVVLIFVYTHRMKVIDQRFHVSEEDESEGSAP